MAQIKSILNQTGTWSRRLNLESAVRILYYRNCPGVAWSQSDGQEPTPTRSNSSPTTVDQRSAGFLPPSAQACARTTSTAWHPPRRRTAHHPARINVGNITERGEEILPHPKRTGRRRRCGDELHDAAAVLRRDGVTSVLTSTEWLGWTMSPAQCVPAISSSPTATHTATPSSLLSLLPAAMNEGKPQRAANSWD